MFPTQYNYQGLQTYPYPLVTDPRVNQLMNEVAAIRQMLQNYPSSMSYIQTVDARLVDGQKAVGRLESQCQQSVTEAKVAFDSLHSELNRVSGILQKVLAENEALKDTIQGLTNRIETLERHCFPIQEFDGSSDEET